MSKFKPGVRVIFRHPTHGGLGGTIVSTRISHQSINYWTSKEVLQITVIFDDGRKGEYEPSELWLEEGYDPDIPF